MQWYRRQHDPLVGKKPRGSPRKPIATSYWEKVEQHETGCWGWRAWTDRHGYGYVGKGGARSGRLLAHRVSWELHYGPIPDGLWVLHRCDNPPCTRPDHLFLGTPADNTHDAQRKGRLVPMEHPTGADAPRAVLTPHDAVSIRERLSRGERQRDLAAEYGVSKGTIYNVAHGQHWSLR